MAEGVAQPLSVAPTTWATETWPLGAAYDPPSSTVTFAVAAPAATRVVLEIYGAATGQDALADIDLAIGPDGVWRGRVEHVGPGTLYGYRVWGPGWDVDPAWARGGSPAGFVSDVAGNGVRFNPNKVLTDPYAMEITHSPHSPVVRAGGLDPGVFGTGGGDYRGRPRREHDTGRVAPKAVVVWDQTSTGSRPRLPEESSAIFETHVVGLTRHRSAGELRASLAAFPGFEEVVDVPSELRGTYAGAALVAPYLTALGFTTVEFLPVHESTGCEQGSDAPNYWGYATLGFFAPNRSYAADRSLGGPTREFKAMMAAFHEAGLEVYLDVVYNHTGEGGNWGGDPNTTGFTTLGGFATPDYYALTDENTLVDGATGVDNQVDASSPLASQLILDSLTHWTDVMGADGFRFDLAPVLGRSPDAHPRDDVDAQKQFMRCHPLLVGIEALAEKRDIEVIAEPWDLWGYEIGNFPPGWAAWNGKYRDALRRFLKGDGNTGDFVTMVAGDYADFAAEGGPQRSVNFVTAHDGFTMADLVSYPGKVNDNDMPFGPSNGGSDDNLSWDSGGDPGLRRQRIRNFWVLLFLSRGVPMVVGGDELGRTQNGNNNPYNLNTIGIWTNWAMAASNAPTQVRVDPDDADLAYNDILGTSGAPVGINPILGFAAYVARLRRDHPALRQRAYGDLERGGSDVSYLFSDPRGQGGRVGGDRSVRLLIDAGEVGGGDLLVMVNMADEAVDFGLADVAEGQQWRRIVDTAGIFPDEVNAWASDEGVVIENDYRAQAWSVVVLLSVPA
ncbi:MAG: alpha-amylase family glycosyl hydrolase [Nostocoides sp.]